MILDEGCDSPRNGFRADAADQKDAGVESPGPGPGIVYSSKVVSVMRQKNPTFSRRIGELKFIVNAAVADMQRMDGSDISSLQQANDLKLDVFVQI